MVDVFIHVPKAAGTTIRSLIETNYTSEEQYSIYRTGGVEIDDLFSRDLAVLRKKKIIYGHIPVVVHHYLRNCNYFTFLRDPITRAISYFKYVKYDFPIANQGRFADGSVTFSMWCKRKNNYEYNRQVKMLSGEERAKFVDRELLERAKRSLADFKYVGFFEDFSESMYNCAQRFGWKLDGLELRNRSSRSNEEFLAQENASESDVANLRTFNEFDLELYDFARDLAIRRGFISA